MPATDEWSQLPFLPSCLDNFRLLGIHLDGQRAFDDLDFVVRIQFSLVPSGRSHRRAPFFHDIADRRRRHPVRRAWTLPHRRHCPLSGRPRLDRRRRRRSSRARPRRAREVLRRKDRQQTHLVQPIDFARRRCTALNLSVSVRLQPRLAPIPSVDTLCR